MHAMKYRLAEGWMRLFKIRLDANDDIRIWVVPFPIDNAPRYHAVSYFCGQGNAIGESSQTTKTSSSSQTFWLHFRRSKQPGTALDWAAGTRTPNRRLLSADGNGWMLSASTKKMQWRKASKSGECITSIEELPRLW